MKQITKNKFFPLLLLTLVSLFFILPLFSSGFYLSHDGEAHVARFAAYFNAFADGQLPLRWAGNLNYGYGSPVFIFYYPLPGILSILIHLLGIGFENVFKIIIGFSFLASFIAFYLWAKELVGKEAAFLGALLYGLVPYHFLNLYVRGDVAELLALAIVPLIFLFIDKAIKTRFAIFVILISIFYSLLILSHNAVSLMFSPVLFSYVVVRSKSLKNTMLPIAGLFSGLLLPSFFWIPALFEARYTNAELFIGDMFKSHFPSLQQLIYSPWGFGANVNEQGGLSPQIGVINLSLAIFSTTLLFQKIKKKKEIIFWVAVFLFAMFLSLSLSSFIWKNVPLFGFLQFPWRITSLSSFASIMLGMYVLNKISDKRVFILLVIAILVYSLGFIKIQPINSKNDSFYLSYNGTTDYHGAASSIWTAGDFSVRAKEQFEIISGAGAIVESVKKSNIHTLSLTAESDTRILDNTVYFPGWQVLVDGKKIPIQFQDANHRGLITFSVPNGRHFVKVYFGESPVRLISDLTSLGSLVLIIFVLLFRKRLGKYILK